MAKKANIHSVKHRVVATFVAALLVGMVVLGMAVYRFLHWYGHGFVDEMGVSAAKSVAIAYASACDNGIDLDDQERYEELRSLLRGVCREYEMSYVYVYACDPERGTITYATCVAADDEADELVRGTCSPGTVVQRQLSEIELNVLGGQVERRAIEYDNELGHTLDWVCLVPERDSRVLAAASYAVRDQRMLVWNSTIIVLVPFALVLLVILLVQLSIMKRSLFTPIALIADRMRAFSAMSTSEMEPLEIASNDEIKDIADAFESMATTIREDVDDIRRLTEERVQVETELEVARRIQLGLVPRTTELERDAFCVSAFSRAALAVGGDFYVVSELDGGRLVAAIGDVSGKGVAAAMFMSAVMTMIHDAFAVGYEPAGALMTVNDLLCERNPEGMFATVFVCSFDPATGEVRYANAGHLPPIVVGGDAELLDVDSGELLGVYEGIDIKEGTLRLEPGEALFVYTDGATEAHDTRMEFLGEERLRERLGARCPYVDATAVTDEAVRVVDEFTVGCEQFDDLTLLTLMRHETASEQAAVTAADVAGATPVDA